MVATNLRNLVLSRIWGSILVTVIVIFQRQLTKLLPTLSVYGWRNLALGDLVVICIALFVLHTAVPLARLDDDPQKESSSSSALSIVFGRRMNALAWGLTPSWYAPIRERKSAGAGGLPHIAYTLRSRLTVQVNSPDWSAMQWEVERDKTASTCDWTTRTKYLPTRRRPLE